MVFMEKNLLDILEDAEEYAPFCVLVGIHTLVERKESVYSWFHHACIARSDKNASKFLSWFIQASVDFDRVDQLGGELVFEKKAAWVALDVYKKISDSNIPFPYLKETRKLIFSKIISWCYKTDDEAESDELFNFFCSVVPADYEERKSILEILKNVTDSSIPVKRLLRHFLSLGLEYTSSTQPPYKFHNHYNYLVDVGLILFNAWRRNQNLSSVSAMMRPVQPIMGMSSTAFEWLTKCAEKIAEIERTHVDEEYTIHFAWSVSSVPKIS